MRRSPGPFADQVEPGRGQQAFAAKELAESEASGARRDHAKRCARAAVGAALDSVVAIARGVGGYRAGAEPTHFLAGLSRRHRVWRRSQA
jgi:hypothetical protein